MVSPSVRKALEVAHQEEVPSNHEIDRAVVYLIAYRLEVVKDMLASAGLAVSGTKAALRKRILNALADDLLSPHEIGAA